MQAVILAGGLGTRMLPRTERVPKSLLPVLGRPFVAWQLDRLVAAGFARVTLCIGHLGGAVREAVGDGAAFGLSVDYSEDGPVLLGTAGALRRAGPLLEESFLVTYGDSYLPFDLGLPLRDLGAHPAALGTMTVYENRGRWGSSNTAIRGDQVAVYDKTGGSAALDHIDYGALALRRSVIEAVPAGQPWGLDVVQADLARRGVLRALVARERFYEIGSPEGLRDLECHLGGST